MTKQLPKEVQAGIFLIIIFAIGIAIFVVSIKIAIIHFFQNMFWINFWAMFVLISGFFIFLIWGILKKDNDQQNNWDYGNQELFDRPVIFIISGGFFILSLISVLLIPYFYEKGYSDQALENLTRYQNQLQNLQELQSVFTGQILWDIENQVIEETISSLCKDSNYPCDQVKKSYEIYNEIKGAKEDADQIAEIFGLIKRK